MWVPSLYSPYSIRATSYIFIMIYSCIKLQSSAQNMSLSFHYTASIKAIFYATKSEVEKAGLSSNRNSCWVKIWGLFAKNHGSGNDKVVFKLLKSYFANYEWWHVENALRNKLGNLATLKCIGILTWNKLHTLHWCGGIEVLKQLYILYNHFVVLNNVIKHCEADLWTYYSLMDLFQC